MDQILHNLEYDIQAPEADQIEKSPKAPLSKSKITSKTDSSRFISFDEEDIEKNKNDQDSCRTVQKATTS